MKKPKRTQSVGVSALATEIRHLIRHREGVAFLGEIADELGCEIPEAEAALAELEAAGYMTLKPAHFQRSR